MTNVRRDLPSRLDHLHRVGAVVFGLGIGMFGVLGFVNRLDMFSTTGAPVLGLSSNGLLSTISVVVAVILIAAGLRGGRTASTVLVVIGAAFVASGLVNTLVLGTPLNLLAFRIPNVVFSFVDNPDALPTTFHDPDDIQAARELADAERAVAQHTAPADVAARIDALREVRSPEERVQRWRAGHA
jgi:hypothetical protein